MMKAKPLLKQMMLTLAVCLIACTYGFAQETKTEAEEPFHPNSQIALILAHAHVFEGRDESGNKQSLSLPAWSFDYNYNFHPKWAIGIHTDLIVEKFKVENHAEGKEGEEIERSYPVAPAVMGIYKLTHHCSFEAGMGGEFASEGSYALTRFGVEYSAEISHGWEVFGTVSYDLKWSAYDTWSTGIGIAKTLGKHK